MQIKKENTIGEVVAQNFHTAEIFEKFGLDFCCGGKKTISEACEKKGLNTDEVVKELTKTPDWNGYRNSNDFDSWELDFLIDYIINTHHIYVMKSLPNIFIHSQKVSGVHGENHPEVISIFELVTNLKEDLESHLLKEEKMLFPYIKKLKGSFITEYPPFGTVANPIRMMELEHENAGEILDRIKKLSNNYFTPDDACTTFKVLYKELKEFEDDLHVHIHLENNILFPKAIKLEEDLRIRY